MVRIMRVLKVSAPLRLHQGIQSICLDVVGCCCWRHCAAAALHRPQAPSAIPLSLPPPFLYPRQQTAALAGTAAAAGGAAYYATLDAQRRFEVASATGPLLRLLDPELSHRAGILAARFGLFPRETRPDPESLKVTLWGRTFPNPIGLAAGFDKDAEAIEGLLGVGFGFMEVGALVLLLHTIMMVLHT